MRVRVPLHGNPRAFATVERDATVGATIGVNVWNNDGTLFVPAETTAAERDVGATLWRLVMEVPLNVQALAAQTGTGLYAITAKGASATRTITATAGETVVANGSGVAGDPVIGLADLTDSGAGALRAITRDAKGRISGSRAATATDIRDASRLQLTASGAISALRAVVAENGLGRYPSAATSADAGRVVGIAVTAAADGATFDVLTHGEWTDAAWTWTPGPVFCGDNGVLTQTPPAGWVLEVGRAMSATRLAIDVKTPFLRN